MQGSSSWFFKASHIFSVSSRGRPVVFRGEGGGRVESAVLQDFRSGITNRQVISNGFLTLQLIYDDVLELDWLDPQQLGCHH